MSDHGYNDDFLAALMSEDLLMGDSMPLTNSTNSPGATSCEMSGTASTLGSPLEGLDIPPAGNLFDAAAKISDNSPEASSCEMSGTTSAAGSPREGLDIPPAGNLFDSAAKISDNSPEASSCQMSGTTSAVGSPARLEQNLKDGTGVPDEIKRLCESALSINKSLFHTNDAFEYLRVFIKGKIGELSLELRERLGFAIFNKVTKGIFGRGIFGKATLATDRDARLRYIKRMTAALFVACKSAGFDSEREKKMFADATTRDYMKDYFFQGYDEVESKRMDVPNQLTFWARDDQLKQESNGVTRRMDEEWKSLPCKIDQLTIPASKGTAQVVQVNDACLADFIQATGNKKTRSKLNPPRRGRGCSTRTIFAEAEYDTGLKARYLKKWDTFIANSPDRMTEDAKLPFKLLFQKWYKSQSPFSVGNPGHLAEIKEAFLRLQKDAFVENANRIGNGLLYIYHERYSGSESGSLTDFEEHSSGSGGSARHNYHGKSGNSKYPGRGHPPNRGGKRNLDGRQGASSGKRFRSRAYHLGDDASGSFTQESKSESNSDSWDLLDEHDSDMDSFSSDGAVAVLSSGVARMIAKGGAQPGELALC